MSQPRFAATHRYRRGLCWPTPRLHLRSYLHVISVSMDVRTHRHTHRNIITIYICVCMYICLLIIYLFVYLFVYTYLFIYPSLCKVHRMKGAGKSASPSVDIQLPQIFRKIGPQNFLQTPIVSHHMFIDYTYICSTKVRKIHGYPGV